MRKVKRPYKPADSFTEEQAKAAIKAVKDSKHSCALCDGRGNCQLQDH